MSVIYSDNGASKGLRTRIFRDCLNGNGVEWMYAVDYASGHDRWYGFGALPNNSIDKMKNNGYDLFPYQEK